jgi:organic radical activating enzyme
VTDRYRVKDGRVLNRSCVVNIVEHCNLRCRSCQHLSPVLPKYSVDPDTLQADLSALAASYHVKVLKLLGGEPLLHPSVVDVIAAARASQVADIIEVWTNGLLLPRVERRFWDVVDSVRISLYPGASLRQHQLEKCIDLARQHNVPLRYKQYKAFQEAYSEPGTDDASLVNKIYLTCNSAHRWRCHTVAHGWFYKCAQSYTIPKGMSLGLEASRRDGIQIDTSPEFRDRLLAYLTSPEPLSACRNCLGSAGKYVEHQQVRRDDFRPAQCHPTEDLVHPRLVGPARVALARAESLLPRAVTDSTEQVMKSSDAAIGLIRKVQHFNSGLFRG